MDPVQRALWYIENHPGDAFSLDEIAAACHVSQFHLTRLFAATLGISLMRYARSRRLTIAAKQLICGADDILQVAQAAGYGSHEAFTRAFREQFQHTPEQVRTQGHLINFPLVEAIPLSTCNKISAEPPRLDNLPAKSFVGIVERYSIDDTTNIARQWQRFTPLIGKIPGQVGSDLFGVSFNFDGDKHFDYLCAVEVEGSETTPATLQRIDEPAQHYIIYKKHSFMGTTTDVRETNVNMTNSELTFSNAIKERGPLSAMIERYAPEFSPEADSGGVEIWLPFRGSDEPIEDDPQFSFVPFQEQSMTAENTKPKVPTMAQMHTSGALAKLGLELISGPTAAVPFAQFKVTEATVEKIRQLVGRTVKVDMDGYMETA
jgi:AraC family transcriptional regulator